MPDNLGTIINYYTSGKFNINGQSKFFEYVNKFCNKTLTNLSDDATQVLSTSRNLLNIALTKLKTDFNGLVNRGVQESYDTSKYIES